MSQSELEHPSTPVDYDAFMHTVVSEMEAARKGPDQALALQMSATWERFTTTPSDRRVAFARFLYERLMNDIYPIEKLVHLPEAYAFHEEMFFAEVLKRNEPIPIDELIGWAYHIFKLFLDNETSGREGNFLLCDVPFVRMFRIINRQAKSETPSNASLSRLLDILYFAQDSDDDYFKRHGMDHGPEFEAVAERITTLLLANTDLTEDDLPFRGNLLGDWYLNRVDDFGPHLLNELRKTDRAVAANCNRLIRQAACAKGSKPTKKFTTATGKLQKEFGADQFGDLLRSWLLLALNAKATDDDEPVYTEDNTNLIKGLVWMCSDLQDPETVNLIADLTIRAMITQPGAGPASQAIANACLAYLEAAKGATATTRLAQLVTSIKQKSARKKIEELVAAKAVEASLTPLQLQERSLSDFELVDASKTVHFGEYSLRISVSGPGDVSQTWLKPDGTPQKSKPGAVSKDAELTARFKTVKADIEAMKKSLSAQRDLMDQLFAEELSWPLEDLEQFYIHHGLVCALARPLIWDLTTGGRSVAALFHEGAWQDVNGQPVATHTETQARLWHPVEHAVADRELWQARLQALCISQPFKQAHREVYALTAPERGTGIYSNRMAAHIVKQHQLASLMAKRNWQYKLLGSFTYADKSQFATRSFSSSDLKAEFLFHADETADDFVNDAGMFTYVATDQLRFLSPENDPISLESVPARLFSETMRDADLFVGVASVGNDPAWQDQGPTPEARQYWDSFAFGDLDSFAETRKRTLEGLLPRLKIHKVARIEGNFLVVQGKLNTYRIHLKSSNIRMDPGNRFLCILKAPTSKSDKVTLPFEGDTRLSVILSKAILLASDNKITDPEIVSQLTE